MCNIPFYESCTDPEAENLGYQRNLMICIFISIISDGGFSFYQTSWRKEKRDCVEIPPWYNSQVLNWGKCNWRWTKKITWNGETMCENITTAYCFHRNERGSSPSVSTSIKADVWRFAQYSRVKWSVGQLKLGPTSVMQQQGDDPQDSRKFRVTEKERLNVLKQQCKKSGPEFLRNASRDW